MTKNKKILTNLLDLALLFTILILNTGSWWRTILTAMVAGAYHFHGYVQGMRDDREIWESKL